MRVGRVTLTLILHVFPPFSPLFFLFYFSFLLPCYFCLIFVLIIFDIEGLAYPIFGADTIFKEGMEIARKSIESGAAYAKLKALVKASGGNLQKLEELEAKYE